jgi:hypothetical protein
MRTYHISGFIVIVNWVISYYQIMFGSKHEIINNSRILNSICLDWDSFRLSENICVAQHTTTFIDSRRLKPEALSRSPEVLSFLFTIHDLEPRYLQLHDIYDDRQFLSTFPPFVTWPPLMIDCMPSDRLIINHSSTMTVIMLKRFMLESNAFCSAIIEFGSCLETRFPTDREKVTDTNSFLCIPKLGIPK